MMMPSIFGENLFDNFMKDFAFPAFPDIDSALYGKHAQNLMKTDVKETESGYEVDIDLPGFMKDEVKASLENGYLTISAAKCLDKNEQEENTGRYIRKERYSGSCERSFYVGEDVSENDIKGEFQQGILRLTIPKQEARPAVEEKKYINIEG
ncbi:Hsp20/alpha crystallin family protein [Lachnospiraceae bacterium 46-15]